MLNIKLREIRKKHGYTQKEIAEVLGIDRSTYTFYETGTTSPAIVSLIKLSRFYGTTLDNLVGVNPFPNLADVSSTEEGGKIVFDESELLLLEFYRNLSPEKKKAVLDFFHTLTK